MPAKRLPPDLGEEFPIYTVVGMYSPLAGGDFVQHVALLKRPDTKLSYGAQNVEVCHMGPPLIIGEKSKAAAGMEAPCPAVHVVGTADLDTDDMEGIKTWLTEVEKEDRPYGSSFAHLRQYVVKPHMDWVCAKETGRRLYRKFSCAGFVIECYRSIGIELVRLPEDWLPEIDLPTVVKAYPEAENEKHRSRYGIPGEGPWRILLAGYVFHALDRSLAEIHLSPYTPTGNHEAAFSDSKERTNQGAGSAQKATGSQHPRPPKE